MFFKADTYCNTIDEDSFLSTLLFYHTRTATSSSILFKDSYIEQNKQRTRISSNIEKSSGKFVEFRVNTYAFSHRKYAIDNEKRMNHVLLYCSLFISHSKAYYYQQISALA
jgi:hypothetical protein